MAGRGAADLEQPLMNVASPPLESVVPLSAELGESPLWEAKQQALYWVDVRGNALNRYDPESGANRVVPTAESAHAIALTRSRRLLAVLDASLAFLDPESGVLEPLVRLVQGIDDNLNDGQCDRMGRMWVGAKARDWVTPIGGLWRVDPDGSAHRQDEGMQLSNGMGWSPDNRTMYFIDSAPRVIYAYDFDFAAGTVRNRRVLVRIAEEHGLPDGMTVDRDGFLWVAQWNGGRVVRYDPEGRIERVLLTPVRRPTSVTFGGRDLDTLYVTSGTMRMTPEERAREPLAGNVFRLRTEFQGLPEPRFAAG
jgi:sugar lactone lactonase YvrE